MRQVAEHYGSRILRNNVCICPFHDDTNPSLKIYDKSFYCYSCGAGGDLISYTGRLLGLNNEEACRQLMQDFGIPVPDKNSGYREKRERELRIRNLREKNDFLKHARVILTVYFSLLAEASRDICNPHFLEAMQELDWTEYRLDCLKEHPEEFYEDKQAVEKIGIIRNRIISWYGQPSGNGTISG